jgi:hypothetical protein
MNIRHLIRHAHVIAVCLTALLLIGCSEEFFDRQAGDRITPDQHYRSIIDLEISMRGAIVSLQDVMPNLIMLDGLRSDMMEPTEFADPYLLDIHSHVFNTDNPYTDPSGLYQVVINTNEVLANLDVVVMNEREMTEHITKYVTGGLIAMRAWAYFTIARLYNEVVWIDDNLTELPGDLNQYSKQHKMTKGVLIDTLINQLIPYVYDATVGVERVEVEIPYYVNTKALLGELYLEKNDYANAVVYLKLACESYGNTKTRYKVDRTFENEAWQTIFLNAETQTIENISVIPFSSQENQFNPLARWMGHSLDYVVRPTQIVIDSFMTQLPSAGDPGDYFRGQGITFNLDTVSKTSPTEFVTEAYITKYSINPNDPFSSDIVISRTADLHLLLAEAYNRIGDAQSQEYALIFLNQGINQLSQKPPEYSNWGSNLGIRGRVDLRPREIPGNVTGMQRTLMIEDMILAERTLELAYEGKRWFDLVRVAERRGTPEYLADKVAAKFQGIPEYESIRNILLNPENWYLPSE